MKRALTAVLLGGVVLAAAGCAATRPAVKPRTGVRQPTLRADAAAEIRAARRSDTSLFRIFPGRPGSVPCAIPVGGLTTAALGATCRTSVSYPTTHGHRAQAFVGFRELWRERGHTYTSGWTVVVQWPAMKVLRRETMLHGTTAPQVRYAASVRRTPANQPALDAAANYAEKIAGEARVFAGVRVDDGSNHDVVYLVHAPQSVIDTLNARHPGTYVIHNDAPRTLRAVMEVVRALDFSALKAHGIDFVSAGPTVDGHLTIGVTKNIAKAQAYFDAKYGRDFIRVVHGEASVPASATGPAR